MEPTEPHFEFIIDYMRGNESDERYLAELDTGMLAAPLTEWADPPAYVHNGNARTELMSARSNPSTPFGRSGTFELLLTYLRSRGLSDPRAEAEYTRVQGNCLALQQAEPAWVSVVNDPLGAAILSSTSELPSTQ